MSRRVISEQIIRSFFAHPTTSRSLFPESVHKSIAPLERTELDKLGKLAALEVKGRDDAFRKSVAQVLDFCGSIGESRVASMNASSSPTPRFLWFESDVPFEPPGEEDGVADEKVREGGNAQVLLNNARRTQEGFFMAPPAKAVIS